MINQIKVLTNSNDKSNNKILNKSNNKVLNNSNNKSKTKF